MTTDWHQFKIGYFGFSDNLSHPADRRRLGSWAREHQVMLNTDRPLESDLVVLSNAANFNYWIKRSKQPVILDLVDGYLGENPSFVKDMSRNMLRSVGRSSSFGWLTYTRHLKYACRNSQAVVVASVEQKRVVERFNPNVWVIEDNHNEIDLEIETQINTILEPTKHIFWEGLGYTLKHFKSISAELDSFLCNEGWGMYILTVEEFRRWGGKYGKVDTKKLIKAMFPLSYKKISVIPWSINNLVNYSKLSDFAIIPINPNDKFASFKPENKLLSMWHLGLPTLCSATPSYMRLQNELASFEFCIESNNWGKALLKFANRSELSNLDKVAIRSYIDSKHTNVHLTLKWDHLLKSVIEGKI